MKSESSRARLTEPAGGELTRDDYLAIRSKLDFRPTLAPFLGIIALDVVCLAAARSLLIRGGLPCFLLSQLLLVLVFFNSFSILHECGHGSAFRSSLLNSFVGHIASAFCFIPYYPWKYIHQKHHTWTGNIERDPVLRSIRRFRDKGVPTVVRISWWTWIPVAAFMQHVVFATYPYVMGRNGELTGAKLVRCLTSLLVPLAVYFAMWRLMPGLVRPGNFILAMLLYLVAEELVNLPHHVDMPTFDAKLPVWQQYRATRSCYYPVGLSELTVLNFNFHIEHHLFPALPWHRLRRARHLVRALLEQRYTECPGISWNVRHRTQDMEMLMSRYRDAKEEPLHEL